MGTLHYAVIQLEAPPNKYRLEPMWYTVATFEFGKDYELFSWLHELSKDQPRYASKELLESLGPNMGDNYHYKVFNSITEFPLLDGFRYKDDKKPCYLFEAMLATFVRLPDNKRIVICQDT